MREMTIQVPELLGAKVDSLRDRLPEVIELGLGELSPVPNQIYRSILEFLVSRPSPQEMMDFSPAPEIQKRVRDLLEKNRQGPMSLLESSELDEYMRINHLITMMKARAIPYLSA